MLRQVYFDPPDMRFLMGILRFQHKYAPRCSPDAPQTPHYAAQRLYYAAQVLYYAAQGLYYIVIVALMLYQCI